MAIKKITDVFRRQRKSAGFTLIELLVTVAIGWIVISGLIYFVVQLLRTDRQEFARTETEREMSIALDYIATDLKDAIYVYDGNCISTGGGTKKEADYCPGLTKNIGLTDSKVIPVLAFWKLESVPYVENPTEAKEQLPNKCDFGDDATKASCKNLLISRNSYTLVVYSLNTKDDDDTWEGPARIVRYELRQYSDLSKLTKTTGYCNPTVSGFTSWPQDKDGNTPAECSGTRTYQETVLVDLVDEEKAGSCPTTSTDYIASPSSDKIGFVACVRKPIDADGNPQLQDVIVYIRGNAVKRAGVSFYNNTSFFPIVQAQIQTRSGLDRTPRPL